MARGPDGASQRIPETVGLLRHDLAGHLPSHVPLRCQHRLRDPASLVLRGLCPRRLCRHDDQCPAGCPSRAKRLRQCHLVLG